jgi:hypothetical protein
MKSQRSRLSLALLALLVCLVPTVGQAVEPYSQDFEFLFQPDPAALANDGWLVYGNVSQPDGTYIYGYGPFTAPNDGFAFCQIDLDQGGPDQGFQQLVVFSDYNNTAHADGNLVESNVYQEYTIGPEDVGHTWKLQFDAKRGNIAGSSTAAAFLKTLDPSSGYATTNLVTVEMTAIPETWGTFVISLTLDASLEGQLFQFGFTNTATDYESSGIFYDNIYFLIDDLTAAPELASVAGVRLGQNYPNPFNPMTRIDFALDRPGNVELSVYDVAGRKVATLVQGSLAEGDHHVIWQGQTDNGTPAASGRYSYVLRTASGQVSRSLVLLK